jgi:hypothetical protein
MSARPIKSRNKREGYYAGYFRPHWDCARKEKRRHHRWDAFSMAEFYPPLYGRPWRKA